VFYCCSPADVGRRSSHGPCVAAESFPPPRKGYLTAGAHNRSNRRRTNSTRPRRIRCARDICPTSRGAYRTRYTRVPPTRESCRWYTAPEGCFLLRNRRSLVRIGKVPFTPRRGFLAGNVCLHSLVKWASRGRAVTIGRRPSRTYEINWLGERGKGRIIISDRTRRRLLTYFLPFNRRNATSSFVSNANASYIAHVHVGFRSYIFVRFTLRNVLIENSVTVLF